MNPPRPGPELPRPALERAFGALVVVLLLLLLAGGIAWVLHCLPFALRWDGVWEYRRLFVEGWWLTLRLALAAALLATVLGIGLLALLRSRLRVLRLVARGWIELVRGTPLLVQLLLGYYVVGEALGLRRPVPAGILLLAIFASAYLAELFRAAIESLPASQWQAARAVGFDRAQQWRLVVIPQALRRALPGVAGQLANLIKDSSLLSVLGAMEFTKQAQVVNAMTYATIESYLPLALGYLLLTLPISWWSGRLERQFSYES